MKRALPLAIPLLLTACTRSSRRDAGPAAPAQIEPADATTTADVDAGLSRGPHATAAPLSWAFWSSDGKLITASKTDLWKLAPTCEPPQRVDAAIDRIFAANGNDEFVVERAGAFDLWSAATMRAVGRIDHPAHGRGGVVASRGGRIALGGCKEIAKTPDVVTSCGEIYDASTGKHVASFVGKHDFEQLAFSDDGKYLVARSGDQGLSVFEAQTGRVLLTRPRWAHIQEVHAWNRPDVAEVTGGELVISHGDTVEHVDLTSGKTLGKLVTPGKTLAVFGPKTRRVAILQGEAGRARIWDVASHAVVRTFDVAKSVQAGANCRHCALEMDEVDEDRVWLSSAYTKDRLLLRIATGEVMPVEKHELRSESVPSTKHRVEERYDYEKSAVLCTLDRRDREAPSVDLPVEYCNRTYGPDGRHESEWPYPGFGPSGRFLGSIYRAQLFVWDVEQAKTVCVAGARK